MLQKLKITSYALIVLLVFVLPSIAYSYSWRIAKSCRGYDCRIEGRICPKGAEGASAGSYIYWNYKRKKMPCGKNYAVTVRSLMRLPPKHGGHGQPIAKGVDGCEAYIKIGSIERMYVDRCNREFYKKIFNARNTNQKFDRDETASYIISTECSFVSGFK